MGYRLVAVDMDGTLLDPKKEITPETVEAVRRVREKGVLFTIATGRPIQGVRPAVDRLGLTGPIITYNGAVIMDAGTGKPLYAETVEPADARAVFALGREYGVTVCVWAGGELYVDRVNERAIRYGSVSGVEPKQMEDEEEVIRKGIAKILWYDEAERIAVIEREMQQRTFVGLTRCTSEPFYLEMFNEKVSKAKAMAKLGELMGVRREEMIAIGDGMNDLEMIRYAGLGVAMGNAVGPVKEAAGYITKTNTENGVAYVLEHLEELPGAER